jgi:hypothetical protein
VRCNGVAAHQQAAQPRQTQPHCSVRDA